MPREKTRKPKERSPSKNYRWSELMKRVFGVDVLKCPACGKPMAVISTLLDESVVKPFLRCIKQPDEPPKLSPARAPPEQEPDFEFDQSNSQDTAEF